MPAPLQTNLSPLLPAQLAQHTVESLYAMHGTQHPWIYGLLLTGALGGLACLQLINVDVSVRAPGLVRPINERVELRSAVSGHLAEVLGRDNERVSAGQPLLMIRSRDLAERLDRNLALQTEHADLISDLMTLTTEPVGVTVEPSGDTAGKEDLAGPLSSPSPLSGGSVVKNLRTIARLPDSSCPAIRWRVI